MVPDAPPRLSTTNCWPSAALNGSATVRVTRSLAPPGTYGTTQRTDRVGCQPCACAKETQVTAASRAAVLRMRRFPIEKLRMRRFMRFLKKSRVKMNAGGGLVGADRRWTPNYFSVKSDIDATQYIE